MSRVGKQPVMIPQGVEAKISGQSVTVKGPKGLLEMEFRPEVKVTQEEGSLKVEPLGADRRSRAFHGLTQALIQNMVTGVTEGFKKGLQIHGIGYRATLDGQQLILNLGHSHPINYPIPEGISMDVGKTKDKITPIWIHGIDKRLVGQVAAEIRAFRPVEPYRGKGIRYVDERVRRKVGKTGV